MTVSSATVMRSLGKGKGSTRSVVVYKQQDRLDLRKNVSFLRAAPGSPYLECIQLPVHSWSLLETRAVLPQEAAYYLTDFTARRTYW